MKFTMQNLFLTGAVAFFFVTVVASIFAIANQSPTAHREATPEVESKRSLQDDSVFRIANVPFEQKKPDFGGEACVAMFLKSLGHEVDQNFIFDQSGVDPMLGRGCIASELVGALTQMGFKPGNYSYAVDRDKKVFGKILSEIISENESGIASVFCVRINGVERFVLVLGVEPKDKTIVYHDPNRADGGYLTADFEKFIDSCVLSNQDSRFIIKIRLAGKPPQIRKSSKERFTNADYAQHLMKLKPKLPSDDFHIHLQKPFVVIGNESKQKIKDRSRKTIKWSVDRIKQDYFSEDPIHIVDIWLFKDKETYETNCVKLFGSKPGTPFGYYSSSDKSLVMNISTGGGTLVHEIVHPFVESNFPECPSWFNEGLASLYEQCRDKNGKIWGSTNWRLRGLQLTIADGRLPKFEELCGTTTREFYDDGRGTNYAQARYLCYYLQEKKLLRKFYHEFRKNVRNDPGGYATLQKILGDTQSNPVDMGKFQANWERYVLKLRYP